MTTSEDQLQVLKIATMRLREALDMERQTSSGNPMTPLSVARFLSGPWLDYIAEPYVLAERQRIREGIVKAYPREIGHVLVPLIDGGDGGASAHSNRRVPR